MHMEHSKVIQKRMLNAWASISFMHMSHVREENINAVYNAKKILRQIYKLFLLHALQIYTKKNKQSILTWMNNPSSLIEGVMKI